MKYLISLLLFLVLYGCSTKRLKHPWIEENSGCADLSLSDEIYKMHQYSQSLASFQIGRIPDSDRGNSQYLYFQSGSTGFIIDGEYPDFKFQVSYAIQKKDEACIIKLNPVCLNLPEIYKDLTNLYIPLGKGFDKPTGINIMHGTSYFLNVRDGEGNINTISHYASDHPMKLAIDRIFSHIESCRVNVD